jgi:tocopherol O-methyltransferase
MISCPSVKKELIRSHYDLATPFYRLLWGQHIHHGLWQAAEGPRVAQQNLTAAVIREAGITAGQEILDVGCGMGGSAIFLAKSMRCRVTGLTLSPVQRAWATAGSYRHRVANRTRFLCADAETVNVAPGAFDVVWSLECTEHLFDKEAFFRRAAAWLRPGGRMAICAWQAADGELGPDQQQALLGVCEGFLCPSLGSRQDYYQWFQQAGMRVVAYHDWTERVARTWEICIDRVRRSRVQLLARLLDRHQVRFLENFQTIQHAYRSGCMRYGCWVAER